MAEGGGGDGSLPWHWHPENPGEEMGRRINDNNAASLAPLPSVTTSHLSDASIFLALRKFVQNNGFPFLLEEYENGSEYLENYRSGEGSGNERVGEESEESEEWNEDDLYLLMSSSSGEEEDEEKSTGHYSPREGVDVDGKQWGEETEDELKSTGNYSPREEEGVDGKQYAAEETVDEEMGEAMEIWEENGKGWRGGHFVD